MNADAIAIGLLSREWRNEVLYPTKSLKREYIGPP